MKVILSRKGFDSSNGGIVSPIIDGENMISFPIPSNDGDKYDDLYYGNDPYSRILRDLKYKDGVTCHVDPDLDLSRRISTIAEWEPIFGQINSSATYLLNTVKVEAGDLFLFFGNFHHVTKIDETYTYIRNSGDFYKDHDLQVIWGYLQIGKIITDSKEQEKYFWHPHSIKIRTGDDTNVMFIASERLSFNLNLKGAGLLKYDVDRVLTAKGCSKARWVSRNVYDVNSIIGNRKNSSKTPGTIYYAGIWQELGLAESEECELWAKSIIEK